jgi:predicted oxidoreductase
VIEAMDRIDGKAVWCTAYLTFVDSEMQRRAGIADDEETFVADARSIVEQVQDRFSVEWDGELLRLFARESAETYRLLEA